MLARLSDPDERLEMPPVPTISKLALNLEAGDAIIRGYGARFVVLTAARWMECGLVRVECVAYGARTGFLLGEDATVTIVDRVAEIAGEMATLAGAEAH